MFREEKQLKKQILLMITAIILLIGGIRLYLDINHNKQIFDAKIEGVTKLIQTLVALEQKKLHTFYTSRANYFLNRSTIIEAVKTKDRNRLYELLIHQYDILKEENTFFSIMHFHLPDGSSFLRMHKPEKHGDDLTELRPMITSVHNHHKPTEGFEIGKNFHGADALQYRLAFPIFDNGTYLGALEFGIGSSQIVSAAFETLQSTYALNKNDIHIALLHSSEQLYHQHQTGELHLCKIGPYYLAEHSDFFETILDTKFNFPKGSHTVTKDHHTYLLQWNQVLLKNYSNKTEGTVLISFDITKDEQAYYTALVKAVAAPMIVLVIMLLFINWAFNYFMKKLMQSHKGLDLQHKYTQSLLNLQENIIITTDGKNILSCNTAFLNFFHVPTLDAFTQTHDCICDFFLEHESFFSLALLNKDEDWINHLLYETEEHKKVVTMLSQIDFEPRAFSVKINQLDTDEHHYVISFTDITDISIKSKEFEYKASHDALTKIYNRMKLNELFDRAITVSNRYNNALSLIMFDIDHFKMVNDTYGHLVGDDVLKQLARHVKEQIRDTDIFARWGGEEFMVVTPHTNLDEAKQLAEKLRLSIHTQLDFKELQAISCSFGVTQFKTDEVQDDILKRVDDALYQAKESGRNCVVVS